MNTLQFRMSNGKVNVGFAGFSASVRTIEDHSNVCMESGSILRNVVQVIALIVGPGTAFFCSEIRVLRVGHGHGYVVWRHLAVNRSFVTSHPGAHYLVLNAPGMCIRDGKGSLVILGRDFSLITGRRRRFMVQVLTMCNGAYSYHILHWQVVADIVGFNRVGMHVAIHVLHEVIHDQYRHMNFDFSHIFIGDVATVTRTIRTVAGIIYIMIFDFCFATLAHTDVHHHTIIIRRIQYVPYCQMAAFAHLNDHAIVHPRRFIDIGPLITRMGFTIFGLPMAIPTIYFKGFHCYFRGYKMAFMRQEVVCYCEKSQGAYDELPDITVYARMSAMAVISYTNESANGAYMGAGHHFINANSTCQHVRGYSAVHCI